MEIKLVTINGVPSYNGYSSVYEALYHGEQEFRDLDFATRMWTTAEVLNNIDYPKYKPKVFDYTFSKHETGVSFVVMADDGDTVMSYNGKDTPPFMKNDFDISGLHAFLVFHEKIHPDDKVVWVDA